jgi:hypothetical protein
MQIRYILKSLLFILAMPILVPCNEPSKSPTKQVSKQKFLPDDWAQSETTSEASSPHEIVPQETLPSESLPRESLPYVSLPNKSFPIESLPPDSLPHESLPFESVLKKPKIIKARKISDQKVKVDLEIIPSISKHQVEKNKSSHSVEASDPIPLKPAAKGSASHESGKQTTGGHDAPAHEAMVHKAGEHVESPHKSNVQAASGQKAMEHQANVHAESNHKASGPAASGHEVSDHSSAGKEPIDHEATGHETVGHEVTGHETTGNETTGHETNGHETNGHTKPSDKYVKGLVGKFFVHKVEKRELKAPNPDSGFFKARDWDDGQAEILTYSIKRIAPGGEQRIEARIATEKLFYRQNGQVARVRSAVSDTEILSLSMMQIWKQGGDPRTSETVLQMPRQAPFNLLRQDQSFQSWPFISFRTLDCRLVPPKLRMHASGIDTNLELDLKQWPIFTEEMLFLYLRALPQSTGYSEEVWLLDGGGEGRFSSKSRIAKIMVRSKTTSVRDMETWYMTVDREGGVRSEFWLSAKGLHPVVMAILADQSVWTLGDISRRKFMP